MQKTYRLIIAYDGTDFHGWQEQSTARTIVSALKNSFFAVFQKEVNILGASRTDSGVHAAGQVARIITDLDIDLQKMITAWNYRLTRGIKILAASIDSDSFNPRSNVKQKTYTYRIFTQFPDPTISRFGWLYPWIEHVDFETFKTVLALYQGTHDFTSFCKFQEKVSPVKTIDSIEVAVESESPSWLVTIKGPSFAHYQIRRMIGYALDASRKPKAAIALIKKLLTNPCHEQPYLKAAASGLTLQKIEYHDEQTH